jgi:hypothetical protein
MSLAEPLKKYVFRSLLRLQSPNQSMFLRGDFSKVSLHLNQLLHKLFVTFQIVRILPFINIVPTISNQKIERNISPNQPQLILLNFSNSQHRSLGNGH